jgi:hypothetical protein
MSEGTTKPLRDIVKGDVFRVQGSPGPAMAARRDARKDGGVYTVTTQAKGQTYEVRGLGQLMCELGRGST